MPALPEAPDGYRIIRSVASGGGGDIYLAMRATPNGESEVALKYPRFDGRSRRQFVREVEALKRVVSPYVARVIDHGEVAGQPWLATTWVNGSDLAALVARDGPRRDRALSRLAVGVAAAVDAFDRAGLMHLDLKPSNVLITSTGYPVVIDPGLAIAVGDDQSRPAGSMGWIPPERLTDPSPGAEVWAAAATIGFAALGRNPFARSSSEPNETVQRRILAGAPADLPDLDGDWHSLLVPALDPDPTRRPAPQAWFATVVDHVSQLGHLDGDLDAPRELGRTMPLHAAGVSEDERTVGSERFVRTVRSGTTASIPTSPRPAWRQWLQRAPLVLSITVFVLMAAAVGWTLRPSATDDEPSEIGAAVDRDQLAELGQQDATWNGVPLRAAVAGDRPTWSGSASTNAARVELLVGFDGDDLGTLTVAADQPLLIGDALLVDTAERDRPTRLVTGDRLPIEVGDLPTRGYLLVELRAEDCPRSASIDVQAEASDRTLTTDPVTVDFSCADDAPVTVTGVGPPEIGLVDDGARVAFEVTNDGDEVLVGTTAQLRLDPDQRAPAHPVTLVVGSDDGWSTSGSAVAPASLARSGLRYEPVSAEVDGDRVSDAILDQGVPLPDLPPGASVEVSLRVRYVGVVVSLQVETRPAAGDELWRARRSARPGDELDLRATVTNAGNVTVDPLAVGFDADAVVGLVPVGHQFEIVRPNGDVVAVDIDRLSGVVVGDLPVGSSLEVRVPVRVDGEVDDSGAARSLVWIRSPMVASEFYNTAVVEVR